MKQSMKHISKQREAEEGGRGTYLLLQRLVVKISCGKLEAKGTSLCFLLLLLCFPASLGFPPLFLVFLQVIFLSDRFI